MWTATITEEAWKKMGSWSLSETPPHRSPHTREAPAEPHVLYDAAAGIGTPFWNSTPFDPRLGLRVESTAAPPRDCIPHYQVDRALYKLT